MKKIGWYEKAKEDLNEIFDFYSDKDPVLAKRIRKSILDEIARLKTHSEIAAPEPLFTGRDYKYFFRSLVIRGGLFKVVYFVAGNTVTIVRIWCCRKSPEEFTIY